ncbi:MAG: hypothetical protein QGI09_08650, partial [Dehalococcoidia bacterium]|nr:hypothetical protein [Dehalococcoidia bacterium]
AVLEKWACKHPWHEKCLSGTLVKLMASVCDTSSLREEPIPGSEAVTAALGQNLSLWKVFRETNLEDAFINSGAWVSRARKQLDNTTKRWGKKARLFHRADRIEIDSIALWPGGYTDTRRGVCRVVRYVLAADDATAGQTKGLKRISCGPTDPVVTEYLKLVGGSWSTCEVSEEEALILVNTLRNKHRVKALQGFGAVLKQVILKKPCPVCAAPLEFRGWLTADYHAMPVRRQDGTIRYWSWAHGPPKAAEA